MVHTEHGDEVADLVARVVEEYFERLRLGEHPQLEEFVEQYPEISDLLKTVIPGLQAGEPSTDGVVSPEQHKQLGDFRILRQIGRGGMGIVYEAEQISMNRRVALKVLPLAGLVDELKIRRFQNEVRAVAALDHPNIVPVYMVGEERGVHYYAMRLIRGRSLSEVISSLRHVRDEGERFDGSSISQITSIGSANDGSDTNLDIDAEPIGTAAGNDSSTISHSSHREYFRSVAALGIQAATALQHAHDEGIIHRDIKPANLLLDRSAKLYITDFGLARVESDVGVTMTGDVIGTLRYMSPEQALAKRVVVDHRADIYSLAATLYELLTLQPVYLASDRQQLLKQIAFEEPTSLRRIDRDIPEELETIVHKAMAKEMGERYSSAQELADDLQSHLENRPIQARPPTISETVSKWTRRNPAITWATIVTLSLVTITLVASTILVVNQRNIAMRTAEMAEYAKYVLYILSTNYRTEKDSRFTIYARESLAASPQKYLNWEWVVLANKAWLPRTSDTKRIINEKQVSNSVEFWKDGTPEVMHEIVPRNGTGTGIMTGKYNTRGTALVITLTDGSAGLYSPTTGEPLASFREPESAFFDTTSSPDDTKLVTSVLTGRIIIYDVATKEPVVASPEEHLLPQATWTWSPDQAYVVSLHADPTIRIWDATTPDPGTVVILRGDDPESGFMETSDIRFFASGDELWSAAIDGTICKWSFPKGKPLGTIEAPMIDGMIHHAISPDGQIAVASFEDGSSFLWEINWEDETRNPVSLSKPKRNVAPMRGTLTAFSPDGTCVAVMNDLLTATIYDVATGTPLCPIEGHSAELRSLEFSLDGKQLLTMSEDGTAKIWTSRPVPSQDTRTFANAHDELIYQIEIDPSGKRLLSGSFDKTARVWDLKTRKLITTYEDHDAEIVAVDFNIDGTRAASLDANGVLHVWDPETGDPFFHIDPQSDYFAQHIRATSSRIIGDMLYFPGVLSTGLFTPDGLYVVTFQKDAMKVFSADDGTLEIDLAGSSDHGWPVYNHDSTLVAILEMYGKQARVWDLHTGQSIPSQSPDARHSRSLGMVAFSPVDDKIISGDMGGKAILRNARTGELLHEFIEEFGIIDSCRFSVDGQLILISYNNGLSKVWDADSGEPITTLSGHLGGIRDVRLSPDGTRLLSWSVDDHAIVWDLARPAANQLVVLSGESRLIQAHWSPDGRDIITAWSDGSIGVWSGATKKDLASLPRFVNQAVDFEAGLNAWRDNLTNAKKR